MRLNSTYMVISPPVALSPARGCIGSASLVRREVRAR